MKLLEKILVPVKVSEVSKAQMAVAVELAKKFKSQLLLLQVLPAEAKTGNVKNIIEKYVGDDFAELLKRFTDAGVHAKKLIAYGNMFEQIIRLGEEHKVNMTLIPDDFHLSDNQQSVDYMVEKLLRKSEKPVWVVKESSRVVPSSILCPVDFSDASARALTNAIKIARIFKAKLNVLNVFEPLEEMYSLRYKVDYDEENRVLVQENADSFQTFLEQFNFNDVNYELITLHGQPYKEILKFAKQHQVDILFMGATGKTLFQRLLLGSVTELVVRDLPCSMVVTKSENILNLKIEQDITDLEKALSNANQLEEAGFYADAIEQVNAALKINDLHLPAIYALVRLYSKTDNQEMADVYNKKADEILKRLWNKKIELEIRKGMDKS
ncbi:universal stress protein [Carboxylicivirga mesophila]|uniref:Universal stress protein n=1 Tax=Carboxylicivirga mesophila TaxID=1166478 RepID=A0ABS5K9U6_9BACT|nr:universal stress protein [Carboxylicivirga mesophila]MBS2211746.1 universal stress protein [Carboxylicivirga mesophila]